MCLTLLVATFSLGSVASASGSRNMEWIDPWHVQSEASARESTATLSSGPTLGADRARLLVRVIEKYRAIEKAGGWQRIPAGEPLSQGLRDPRVTLIRARLAASGDVTYGAGDPGLFDAALADAVRKFQEQNGLPPDGRVGRRVIDAMNVPVGRRIRQLQASLSRLNKVSGELARRYVFVNIAGQEVEAVENGRVALRKRVIVGKEDRQTPEYTSKITEVTLNPYWNVPYSIATKDMLSKIRNNPGFLDRMGIRVFRNSDGTEVDARSVAWSQPGVMSRYRLRQDPSKYNSLGTVKINFPNPHAVYLHDTPTKTLFGREERNFSSGCVRVEDVRELAVWLLKPTGGWSAARVDAAIARGKNLDVPLVSSVPIYMFYLTAWVDEEGHAHFRDDVYDRTAS